MLDILAWVTLGILAILTFIFNKKQVGRALKSHSAGFKKGYQQADKMWQVRLIDKIRKLRRELELEGVLLTITEAASFMGFKSKTLYNMRSDGKGPEFILLGGKPFYRQVDVERWQHAQGEAALDVLG